MQGSRQGYVRFTKPGWIAKALKNVDAEGNTQLDSVKASVKVISGEEEKNFYYRVLLFSHIVHSPRPQVCESSLQIKQRYSIAVQRL